MSRRRRRRQPAEPTVHVVRTDLASAPPAFEGNHAARRALARAERRLLKRRRREEVRPLTEAEIPPGSLLSQQTLDLIRAGAYGVARYIRPTATPARRTYAQKLRQRARARRSASA